MPDDSPAPPAIDAAALTHLLGRLAKGPGAPWLHQEVARRMAERLTLIKQPPERWIDWWGHLGGSAQAVREALPQARRLVVEPTPRLAMASRHAAPRRWWQLGQGPADAVSLTTEIEAGQAQMVWANMMLHLSPNPPATVAGWHAALAAEGFLMFSTLGPDTLRELRQIYADQAWPAPHPPFTDMHNFGDLLVGSGFADPVMDQEVITLTWSSAAAALQELRAMGANLGPQRHAGLRTPRWHAQLCAALQARADGSGRIHMSFEVVYGHAFKAAPKPARGELATVSLESLRGSLRALKSRPEAQ